MPLGARTGRRYPSLVIAICLTAAYVAISAAPAASEERFKPRDNITIRGDEAFDAAHGVVEGSGTPADPYVIEGWKVSRLELADTSAAVLIRDNLVTSQMILNWNGPNVTVIDNQVNDLRVNQNVKRTGAATGGSIAHNSFGRVGQLRHFDGVFEENIVKPGQGLFDPLFGPADAVTFDGFNGSVFRNNTIYGPVDVQLHGHHHGSDFGAPSHHHSHGAEAHDMGDMDHTKRYHRVTITDNTIYSDGPHALRWTDAAHRGDDRTAASEQNEELNQPHRHWTRVKITGNRMIGSGLFVDIFNPDDQNHLGTERGSMTIVDNVITLQRDDTQALDPRYGIQVWDAKDLDLVIAGNQIVSEIEESAATKLWQRTAGIFLESMDIADIDLSTNDVANTYYGIRASYFTETVQWRVAGLQVEGVQEDVYYDESVKNPPERSP